MTRKLHEHPTGELVLKLVSKTGAWREELAETASAVFGALDETLEPRVLVIQVEQLMRKVKGRQYRVEIEQCDAGVDLGTLETAITASFPYDILLGDALADLHKLYEARESFRRSVECALDLMVPSHATFCSNLVFGQFNRYTCVCVQLPKAALAVHSRASQPSVGRDAPSNLLLACVTAFLRHCELTLSQGTTMHFSDGLPTEGHERQILREAGRLLMFAPRLGVSESLFDDVDALSDMTYESSTASGTMVLAGPEDIPEGVLLAFDPAIPTDHHRGVRKLLQLSSGTVCLAVTDDTVWGLIRFQPDSLSHKSLFSVAFMGRSTWEWRYGDSTVMRVVRGQPSLPKAKLDQHHFRTTVEELVPTMTELDLSRLWTYVLGATQQKKGALIVVAEDAKQEASRLRDQSTRVTPRKLGFDSAQLVTAIDGAILSDFTGTVYAVGVILDGRSRPGLGNPSRGSRYNSAVKYVRSSGTKKRLAVVVSEDGSVDIVR